MAHPDCGERPAQFMKQYMKKKEVRMKTGFFGLLGIAFITLKLCGIIDWSWWFVTMPLWFGIAIGGFFVLSFMLIAILGVIAVVVSCVKK